MSRRTLPLRLIGMIAGGLVLLAGCATAVPAGDAPTPADSDALGGTGWVLDTMAGQRPKEGTVLTLQVTPEGAISGSSGCNRYNGTFRADGDALDVDPINSTLMMCEQPVMNQETTFIDMLQTAEKFVIEADHLTVSGGADGATLVFRAQSQDLEGGTWVVTGYHNGAEAVVSVLNDTVAELSFNEDGTISGTGGCNRITGQFTAEDGTLEIGALGMTQMACSEPAGVMEQESALVTALESSTTYEVQGDELRLTMNDASTAVTLTRG